MVLYEEGLDQNTLQEAVRVISEAGVWLRVEAEHLIAVKPEKLIWPLHVKRMAQYGLRRIVVLLVIRETGLCWSIRHPRRGIPRLT